MTDFGEIEGEFAVDDIADGELSEVKGSLRARVKDIGLIAAFFPAVDRASGRLAADIRLSGSVIDPLYSGEVVLENGSLRYRPIGLRLDDFNLTSKVFENGELELSGQMRMGEGTAVVNTRTDFLRALSGTLEMQISGDNLTIIDVPDLKAIASTELDLGFDGETLSINGRVDVPTALVTPNSLGGTPVSESEDVVIVAGELPDDFEAGTPRNDLRIEGELTVNVGDNVTIDVGLAEADVAGSVVMTWTGDVIPMANGRYDLSGDILAFGQKLQITEGGIRFPNVPANQPRIRLMAVREIFGNSEVREAGVLIDGRLSRPTIQPYTIPVTTEERAVTLLVTGSDFNYEQGIGAVDFGTYIAPRVFASYGIGLFDQENVIRVRYDLKRGFGITTTSGQRESGVDLSYRFEN
jgi:translocation and assembly module TamB